MKKMKIDNIIIQIIGNWIDQMQKKNWLLEEDREYYQYAMEVRLEEILTIATVFFVIICMRQFVNGLTFLVSFLLILLLTLYQLTGNSNNSGSFSAASFFGFFLALTLVSGRNVARPKRPFMICTAVPVRSHRCSLRSAKKLWAWRSSRKR